MRNLLLICVLFVSCSKSASYQSVFKEKAKTTTPVKKGTLAELKELISAQYQILDFDLGDLDGDGDLDALAALRLIDEVEYPSEQVIRPLIIYLRGAEGKLMEYLRNDHALYCYDCGGCLGDPFQGVEILDGAFKVHHYTGCWYRTSHQAEFSYNSFDSSFDLVELKTMSGNVLNDGRLIQLEEKVIGYNEKYTFESYSINDNMP